MRPIAAIDIGSNAVRLAVGELDSEGKLRVIRDAREAVRLGQDAFSTGIISDLTLALLVDAFNNFKKIISDLNVSKLHAVATSALREAINRKDILKAVRERTGIEVEMIGGEKEAELIHLAVSERIELEDKLALLIDIGGGSVEVTLVDHGDVVQTESAPMGTVRLLKILEQKKNPGKALNKLIRDYSKGIRAQIAQELQDRKLELAAGTGGNIDILGELRAKLFGGNSEYLITRDELAAIVERLQTLSYEERISELNLRPDRADVIFPAAVVLLAVLDQAKVSELHIPHVGLKEGVLIEMLSESKTKKRTNRRRQVMQFAQELGKKYDYEELHAKTVAKLALLLFDQLKPLHDLGEPERLLLETAAMLHDIGQYVNYNGHHKHSAYLISACSFVGLSEREQNFVAALARYHRKAPPKEDHPEFVRLHEDDRKPLYALAGILRVADALDREHASIVTGLTLDWSDKEVRLKLEGSGEMLLERWAVEKKGKLFEEFFRRELKIED